MPELTQIERLGGDVGAAPATVPATAHAAEPLPLTQAVASLTVATESRVPAVPVDVVEDDLRFVGARVQESEDMLGVGISSSWRTSSASCCAKAVVVRLDQLAGIANSTQSG